MIPFDFIIEGPPVSHQTRNKARLRAWKQQVRIAAESYWPGGDPPSTDQLRITLTNFYELAAPDVDNIVKPIQDALKGLVYDDDSRITDAVTRKRDINGSFKIKGMSKALADGFQLNKDFVHVKVELSNNFEHIL